MLLVSTGRLVIPNRDTWAIDGTVLVTSSANYFVYSSWDGDNQCLWISCVFHCRTSTPDFPSSLNLFLLFVLMADK